MKFSKIPTRPTVFAIMTEWALTASPGVRDYRVAECKYFKVIKREQENKAELKTDEKALPP